MIKTIYDNGIKWKGETGYNYILVNIENQKWYFGTGKSDPEDEENPYVTSSELEELLVAIASKKIERHIVGFDDWKQCTIIEAQYLNEKNAVQNPMSYNQSNFTGSKEKQISNLEKMKAIAVEITATGCYAGIKPKIIRINKKNGVLNPSDPMNSVVFMQPRYKKLDSENINDLATVIDDANGNINDMKQRLLIVILKDIKWNEKVCDLVPGGSHTWAATLKAKYGYYLNVLEIPVTIHGTWLADEVRDFGLFLNPREPIKKLESSIDDIAKRVIEKIDSGLSKDSTEIKTFKKMMATSSTEKRKITVAVDKILKTKEHEANKPKHFIDYTEDSEAKKLDDMLNEFKKDPHTFARKYSTGKVAVGDLMTKIVTGIEDGTNNVKRIVLILHHPNVATKERYEKEYKRGFLIWKKVLETHQSLGIKEFKIIEMPIEREETEVD